MEFAAFGVTEAQLLDVLTSSSCYPDDECVEMTAKARQEITLKVLESLLFRPRVKSISESGVSISYDFDGLGRWYMFLCRQLGKTPNDEIVGMLGLSTIIDKTNMW